MNKNIPLYIVSSILLTSATQAEDAQAESIIPGVTESKLSNYLKFSLDARLRYESKIEQGFDNSDAVTLRVRPGITILPGKPFSAFIEGEHTAAIADDFRALNDTLDPFRANNAQIIDPETNELNQAYIQFKHEGLTLRAGRQRIILDNAAFIGNVGWRQNEQTFDALSASYKKADTSLYYAYSTQANRIFGSDAEGAFRELEGNMHFINASTKINDVKVGGYVYLLDFDNEPGRAANQFSINASTNTYGVQADYKGFHAEYAYQTEAGDNDDYNASYAHLHYTKKAGEVTYKAGVEYLEEGFITPLATVHAFNGFADRFIAHRLGLPGAEYDGLTDFYAMAATKVKGVAVKGFLHYYLDDSLSNAYGWEADLVLAKKLSDSVTLLGKTSFYVGDDGNTFDRNITQTSVQLDYKF